MYNRSIFQKDNAEDGSKYVTNIERKQCKEQKTPKVTNPMF